MAPPSRSSQEKSKKHATGESSRPSRGNHSRHRNRGHNGSSRRASVPAGQDSAASPAGPSGLAPDNVPAPVSSTPLEELRPSPTAPASQHPASASLPAHPASGGKAWQRKSTDTTAGDAGKLTRVDGTTQDAVPPKDANDLASRTPPQAVSPKPTDGTPEADHPSDSMPGLSMPGTSSHLSPETNQKSDLSFQTASALTTSGLSSSPLRSPMPSPDPSLFFDDQAAVATPATPASSLVCTPEPGLSASSAAAFLGPCRSEAASPAPGVSASEPLQGAFPLNGEAALLQHAAKNGISIDPSPAPAASPLPEQPNVAPDAPESEGAKNSSLCFVAADPSDALGGGRPSPRPLDAREESVLDERGQEKALNGMGSTTRLHGGKLDEDCVSDSSVLRPRSASESPAVLPFPNGDALSVSTRAFHDALAAVAPLPLSFWPSLRLGRLANGLEYRILQHSFPAHKIAAHLVVHVGSVHEEENEQGLAHLLEHCVFQGTEKFPSAALVRRELGALGMSFGGDLNAYTDFHHTAYTLHSPVETPPALAEARTEDDTLDDAGEKTNLERCLVLLRELVFAPLLEDGEPLEAERRAVLSEEQLRHSVQYRVEKKMYEHLHRNNKLARRFPIGLTEQVKRMTAEDLRRFKRRWYRPANAVLLVVADLDADLIVEMAENIFSPVPPDGVFRLTGAAARQREGGTEAASRETQAETEKEDAQETGHETVHRFVHGRESPQDAIAWAQAGAQLAKPGGACLPRHPDVYEAATPRELVFQHHLLRGLVVVIAGKEELSPLRTMQDFFTTLVDTCISCVRKRKTSKCDMLSLLARDSMTQQDCQDAETLVDEIVETLTTGCILLSRTQEYEAFEALAAFITPQVIQARCQEVFYHIVHFFDAYRGSAETPRASLFVYGPTHECTDEDLALRFTSSLTPTQSPLVSRGNTVGSELVPQGSSPQARGRVLRSGSHSNFIVVPAANATEESPEGDAEEGVAFLVTAEEVETAVAKALRTRPEHVQFHLPDSLLDRDQLDAYLLENPPKFVLPLMRNRWKLHGPSREEVLAKFAETDGFRDEETETQFWRFENGASVNAKSTDFEPSRCQVRLFFFGGELMARGDERQLLDLGIRTLMDGGVAGHLQKSVDKLCAMWGIYVSPQVEPEGVSLTVTFDAAQEEALDHAFELIHSYLEHPSWSEDVFERQKQFMKTSYEMSLANLDFLSSVALTYQLYPHDRRWVPANSAQLQSYTLEQAKAAVERQLQPHLLEVCVVGEFKMEELKGVAARYIGSLKAKALGASLSRQKFEEEGVVDGLAPLQPFTQTKLITPFLEEKQRAERCSVTVALRGFGRYDFSKTGNQASFKQSPSYRFRVWRYIEEIMNNRLHDEMREKRQLGYSFSCHTAALEFQDVGVILFGATPLPAFAAKSWNALCAVIRDLCTTKPPRKDEYLAARQVVTSGFSTSFKTNEYWMALLFGLQLPTSPKDIDSIKRIPEFYEKVTETDILEVMRETLFASPMISCIAISGPREIKELLGRLERAVKAKLAKQLPETNDSFPQLRVNDLKTSFAQRADSASQNSTHVERISS
ncbi:putative M16 family peptidase [Neospora caninum Liverpool]|uniref:Putative M16 family peptidase n=1 Tax=Neospora caninum (strain Liverpool) TaxID=572307 RepID=F0VKH6_NEOCL|nr:putative M16 family peptidase [Neospora caninum Liverpool]CBZ54577.1 putative M16 family peptidase [Neospora caninum Liverpool]|eukprot:XP_003884607.1 putative M16 family peptidase [Neospora caninum Liverpool]